MQLILASTSPFRKALLQKLGLPFRTAAPDVDESRLPGESPDRLVMRLSHVKAAAIANNYSNSLIIGSDQVACIDDDILGKPGTRENAIRQLQRMSGKTIVFHTGLCLFNSGNHHAQVSCELYKVHFRHLSEQQIHYYVDSEQPYNCAGSFKSEGLGITLFRRLEGDDPNTLIGLPLIRLVDMLSNEDLVLPVPPQ